MLGRLGAYEIVGIVGRGGMGVVLKGLDRAAQSFYVAIKTLARISRKAASARRRLFPAKRRGRRGGYA